MLAAVFTEHAFDRVAERLHLLHEDVAHLLEEDKYILLGKDGSSNRVHKLFFSQPDKYWFVAVQDETTAEVVTVLPIDYHNRWQISGDALSLARAKVLGQERMVMVPPQPAPELLSGDVVLRFAAKVRNRYRKKRIIGLGKIFYCSGRLSRALCDPVVRSEPNDRLVEELIEGEILISLTVRHGKSKMNVRLATLL